MEGWGEGVALCVWNVLLNARLGDLSNKKGYKTAAYNLGDGIGIQENWRMIKSEKKN